MWGKRRPNPRDVTKASLIGPGDGHGKPRRWKKSINGLHVVILGRTACGTFRERYLA